MSPMEEHTNRPVKTGMPMRPPSKGGMPTRAPATGSSGPAMIARPGHNPASGHSGK